MGNSLNTMGGWTAERPPQKLPLGYDIMTKNGSDLATLENANHPNRKTYGPPLQKYVTPGDIRGYSGTLRYGNSSDNNFWIGSSWFFIWASCANHRHPHDPDCQMARFRADSLLAGPETFYGDNMYNKGLFDPVLGEWGYYGRLSVTERRAFTSFFDKRKAEIEALIESEGSASAAQDKMMANDRVLKLRGITNKQLFGRALQLAEYLVSFRDDLSQSRADRYLAQAKALDNIRIQKAQVLMAAGVPEQEALKLMSSSPINEAAYVAGGAKLKKFIAQSARQLWLKANTVDADARAAIAFSASNDLAEFPLTDAEKQVQASRQGQATTDIRQQGANVTAAIGCLLGSTGNKYSARIQDWIENPSTNPIMVMAEMMRTFSPEVVERDVTAPRDVLIQREYEALLSGPSVGEEATAKARVETFNKAQSQHERITAAPHMYFDPQGNYVDGKMPWEETSRRWLEDNEDKFDPDYENWMRARAKQLWRAVYGENFPTTVEAVKEIAFNPDVRYDFFKRWKGIRRIMEVERDHKYGYRGQPFKYHTLPTPGINIDKPGSYEFSTRFGTVVSEGHPYIPGTYWTYPPTDFDETIINPGVPFNYRPTGYGVEE